MPGTLVDLIFFLYYNRIIRELLLNIKYRRIVTMGRPYRIFSDGEHCSYHVLSRVAGGKLIGGFIRFSSMT